MLDMASAVTCEGFSAAGDLLNPKGHLPQDNP